MYVQRKICQVRPGQRLDDSRPWRDFHEAVFTCMKDRGDAKVFGGDIDASLRIQGRSHQRFKFRRSPNVGIVADSITGKKKASSQRCTLKFRWGGVL